MSSQDEFRKFAEVCRQLAVEGDASVHRATLGQMAMAWNRLAVEEERIADLVREVDSLFAAPGPGQPFDAMWKRLGDREKRAVSH